MRPPLCCRILDKDDLCPARINKGNDMRVTKHAILELPENPKIVTIYFNGTPVEAIEGEPIAAALVNAGVKAFRRTPKHNEPRGIFCAIGRCTDCVMMVDGKANVRTCVTEVRDGMRVETQYGNGDWRGTT